jgi:hypothetical protein
MRRNRSLFLGGDESATRPVELKELAWLLAFRSEGVRRTQCARQRTRVLTTPEPNATLFGVLLCLPTAPVLPPGEKGDFGRSPIYGQLSDKHGLPLSTYMEVRDIKRNREEELKAKQTPSGVVSE